MVKAVVGNESDISFWFDSWTSLGPLIKRLGVEGPSLLLLPLKAKVATACNGSFWTIPSPRSDAVLALHAHLTTVQVPNNNATFDEYYWV